MPEDAEQGIGLAEAIGLLRAELIKARSAAAGSAVQFPVESMTVELKVTAIRSASGKAGFRVPFVNMELGASAALQHEAMQTVMVTFGSPLDSQGNALKVVATSDELKG
jgi:hypothetical protein